MRLRTPLLAGTAAVIVVAAISLRNTGKSAAGSAPAVASGLPPAAAVSTAKAPSALVPAARDAPDLPGSQRLYDVDFTEAVTLTAGNARRAKPDDHAEMVKSLRASWLVTCVLRSAGRVRYRGLLRDVAAEVNGEPYPEGEYLRDFERPFFFETDEEGKVLTMAFEAGAGSDARATLKSLVARSQIVARGDAAARATWIALEEDTTGEYEATYTREDDAGHVRKARARYLRIATPRGLVSASDVGSVALEDDTRITLTAPGALEDIASQTTTEVRFGPGMPVVHAKAALRAHMTEQPGSASTAALAEMSDAWKRQQKVEMAAAPEQEDPRDAAGRAPPSALAELQRELAATGKGKGGARGALVGRLQTDFRLHPEDAAKVVPYVRSASVADGQSITAALGGAGTPEALRALVAIANTQATAMDVRVNAIGALAVSQVPSTDTVHALKRMTSDGDSDIHSASTLALGAAAATVRATDPAAYEDAVGVLLAQLAAATTPEEMILALRALGNSADPRVLGGAERAMAHPGPVRVAAVAAVRFVQGVPVDAFLRRAMAEDPDPSVRAQAIATIEGYRAVTAQLTALGAVLRDDLDAVVRRAALHALNVAIATPEARALIALAAQRDPSEEVRAYAQAILDAPTSR